jgi:hypothetical protein
MLTITNPVIVPESSRGKDLSAPCDLHAALFEAAKEMNIDWPEFPSIKWVRAGIAKTALGLLLFAFGP